ncbi:hypothetical protein [Deinococcus hopiensis]|uniref:Uncharacterized protein n=1 Tax=Deinococcus hopiensis KR-140 TaxID=695939 RepID=A0A1W1VCJ0_9DEIO|nr:hypothetical protein [Deinococcus hopiensis]SMB91177.1 hypothetical protein SAMN00790413_01023 [Deinococcus hopiensis KR-140]
MKQIELMGVTLAGWKAGGMVHLAAAAEGEGAEMRASLLAALLELKGMTVEVAPCRATDESLILVNVNAEVAT